MPTLGSGGPPEKIPSPPKLSLAWDDIPDGDVIGQGGNADVYRTTITQDGDSVPIAIKQPRFQGTLHTDAIDRFVEEIDVWHRLDDHDHIVTLFDSGTDPLPWLAMEYMDGGSLRGLLSDGQLPTEQALWVGYCICQAVHYAHRHGIAHYDLKPANILFQKHKDHWMIPKVSDWGLAQMMLDETGSIEGMSPHYSAPEQFDTEQYGSPNDQTDIYQIGTLIYELLTGNPPFEGSITAVMQGVLSEKPTPPSEVADLPKAVDNLLMPALQKEQADRYDSLVYLRDGLSELTTSDWSNVETTTSSIKTRSPSEVSSTNKSTIKEAQPNEDANRPQKQNEALNTKVDSDPSTSENKRFLANRRSILVVLGIGTIGVGGWQANSHNLFSSSNSPTADEDGTQESSTSDTEQESTSDTTSNGGNTEPSTNEESSEEIDRANAFLADEGADGANGYDGSLVDETGSDSVTIANGAGDGYTYDPPGVIIDAGTTVTWEWTDQGGNHNVVSMEEGDYDMESELTDEEGFTFENTFEEAGVSLYYCQPHRARGMAGAIVIM